MIFKKNKKTNKHQNQCMVWTENNANTAVCWRNNATLKTTPLTFQSQDE